jgi:hypothetical protein
MSGAKVRKLPELSLVIGDLQSLKISPKLATFFTELSSGKI